DVDAGGIDGVEGVFAQFDLNTLTIHADLQRWRGYDHAQAPKRQPPCMCSATNSPKWRSNARMGLGAICPRPHTQPKARTSFNSLIVSRSACGRSSNMCNRRTVPSRHGVHLPQLSREL